jgi:hypothetical protein
LDRERRLESERRQEQERRWQAEKRLEAERNNRSARNRFADSDDRQFQTSRDDGFDLERRGVTNRGQERLLAERRMENRMAEQRMAERRRTDQNIDDRENEGLDYKKRQLALENAELRRELEDERDIRNRTQRELARERRFSDSIERERLLDDEERMRHDDRDWVNNRQRYANRRDDDFGDRIVVGEVPPNDQYVNTTTTRNNASPQPSGRLPTFSINGPNNDRNMPTVENRTEWALWFIMLASVGLNFYLSWIARGFYIRYEELADEIRDTFTNTM